MARTRIKLAAIVVILVLSAAACWLVIAADGAPQTFDAGTDKAALPGAGTGGTALSPVAPRHAANTALPVKMDAPVAVTEPDLDPDGPWLISGRVEFASFQGVDLASLLRPHDREIRIEWLDFSAPDSQLWDTTVSVGPDGSFTTEILRHAVNPSACAWVMRLRRDHGESALKRAAAASPRPERGKLQGLAHPRIEGRRVDFGLTRIDLATMEGAPVIVTGRLVHVTGFPCTTLERCTLTARAGESTHCEAEFCAAADGRFAGYAFGAPRIGYLEGCKWQLEFLDTEKPIEVGAPTLVPGRADFGDIKIGGALLDISVVADGAPPILETPDPSLWMWGEFDPPALAFRLDYAPHDWIYLALPPRPARIVLPEMRTRYFARLDRPDWHAKPLKGTIAARSGQRTELVLRFEALKTVPLRVLDPRGLPAKATISWSVEKGGDGEEREGGRMSGFACVPVFAGRVTNVEASSDTWASVAGSVTVGDRELVLRFTDRRANLILRLIMPVSPAESGEGNFNATVVIEYAGPPEEPGRAERYERNAWLWAHQKVAQDLNNLRPGKVRLWLFDRWKGGYPDGRMTAPIEVTLPESGILRVELPDVAPPPWGTLSRPVVARVLCDGTPVRQRGKYRFGPVTREREYSDGESVDVGSLDPFDSESPLADALVASPHDIPLAFRPPRTGHDGELRLDLPARLRMSLTVSGRPAPQMGVGLVSSDSDGYACWCDSNTGRAALWARPGKHQFRVRLPDRGEIHCREVEIKDGECLEFNLVVGDFRVDFTRPDGARDEGSANWTVHSADSGAREASGERFSWGGCAFLRAGRYVARSDVPYREEVRVEFEVTRDCEVLLPGIEPFPTGSLLLKIRDADWKKFFRLEFEYFAEEGRERPGHMEFQPYDEPLELEARVTVDGMLLGGLPLGKRVCVRGLCREMDDVLLEPVILTVKANNEVDARWLRPVRIGRNWSDFQVAVTTDFAGRLLPFDQMFYVRPGKHELAVFIEGKEAFRHTVTVPDKSETFEVPADLLKKLDEARERAKPADE